MKPSCSVRYFDGKINRAHHVQLSLDDDGNVCLYDENHECVARFQAAELSYLASVGQVRPALELPDDARIEFLDHHIPEWLPLKNKKMLHHVNVFEKSWKWVAIGFVTVSLVIFGTFRWGIPTAAHFLAFHLPENVLHDAGEQTEKLLLKYYVDTTTLPEKRQQEIQDLYHKILAPKNPAKLLIVKGNGLNANAFAIPNNTIMMTEELIKLAKNDHEILAVLAHEQGHLVHRHSFQQVLRSVGVGVFLLIITGDGSDLINVAPTLLVSAHYSQGFELEADKFAIDLLKAKGISPKYLADFLQRLEHAHHGDHEKNHKHQDDDEDEQSISSLLRTHPLTLERVKQVKQYSD